jgi:zinc/manganese transport system substrate-binding protein
MTHSTNSRWRIVLGIVFLIAVVVVIAIPIIRSPSTPTGIGLQVVAAENFWGNIAGQIGGKYVHVTSIITDPSADPHLYESSAQNAAAIASAKVVIVNGLGYDDFMNKLLATSNGNSRTVLTAADILNVHASDANPHLWYDVPRVHIVADAMAASFAKADPTNAAVYAKNAAVFDNSLKPLLATITTIKQKYADAPVAYTERVPGYLLAAAGLSVKTPQGFASAIEDGNDPSPSDTADMNRLITNKEIRVLLYNSQATSAVTQNVQNLARLSGIPVIGVTETLPASQHTYQSWQQSQLNALLGALK